jgi:hypothetical protein
MATGGIQSRVMRLVERAKELWYQWIPGWLPVVLAILSATWWVSATVTGMQRDVKSLQKQVEDIEDYLRHQHSKNYSQNPEPDLESPQDGGLPPTYQPR